VYGRTSFLLFADPARMVIVARSLVNHIALSVAAAIRVGALPMPSGYSAGTPPLVFS
jgi:hypothetical protein